MYLPRTDDHPVLTNHPDKRDIAEQQWFTNALSSQDKLISALETKFEGPLTDTCKFSTSPKSLIRAFEAFSLALIITLGLAEIEFIRFRLF